MTDRRVHLNESSAGRIGSAVRKVERSGRDMSPVYFRQVGDDGDPVRLCKTVSAWSKGTNQTLNIWESGSAGSETQTTGQTVAATNKFANVASGKFVIVARAGNGVWYLIAAEC